MDMEVSPQLPPPPDPLNQYKKEDVKLLTNNHFSVMASVLFIVMAIVVVVLVTKRVEMRDKGTADRMNNRIVAPTVSPAPAEWKTYTSNGNYLLEYPSNSEIYQNKTLSTDGIELDSENTVTIVIKGVNSFTLVIKHSAISSNQSLESIVESMSWCYLSVVSSETYQLSEEKALLFANSPCGLYRTHLLYSVHNSTLYSIEIMSNDDFEKIRTELDQILSTFRFTDQKVAQ